MTFSAVENPGMEDVRESGGRTLTFPAADPGCLSSDARFEVVDEARIVFDQH